MSNSATPWTTACQTSLSMWFSRQENWSGLPFLLERIFPSRRSNPSLLHCRQFLYRLSWQGSPIYSIDIFIVLNMNILLVRIVSNAKYSRLKKHLPNNSLMSNPIHLFVCILNILRRNNIQILVQYSKLNILIVWLLMIFPMVL